MSQIEILNDSVHRDLHMKADSGEPVPHFLPVVIGEFSAAAATCPIFLSKDAETGEFFVAALFGFEPGELLVDGAETGRMAFQPLDLQRRGFYTIDEKIGVDTAHPRFGAGADLPLFESGGQPSNLLRKIQRVLGELTAGMAATREFIAAMLRLKLIEPIDIALRFDDGRSLSLDGLYTISRDGLNDLADEEVVTLFRSGHLGAALCITLSLSQVPVFAQRRNERLTA